jgi:Tfp pilus assembly protein PilF
VVVALFSLLLQASADYQQGVSLFERGELDAAIAPLTRAVEASPKDAQAWKVLGVVYAAKGDYALAEEPFRRACELKPDLVDACYFLARARYARDRFEPSLEALKKALAVDAKPWRIRLAMAQSLEGLGNAAEADKEYRAAISLNKDMEDARVAYAHFLFRQGRLADARKQLEETVTRFAKSARAHYELGRVLMQVEELNGAVEHLEKSVSLDPASRSTRLLLSKVYFRLGRAEDAQRQLTAAGEAPAR